MKKFFKSLIVTMLLIVFSAEMVSAEINHIAMIGTAQKGAKGVTLLVLNKDATYNSMQFGDIAYISQADINEDGTFYLNLPLFSEDEYNIYSNMDNYEFLDTSVKKTLYVSSSGSDSNTGESVENPLATLTAAYKKLYSTSEIVLMNDISYTEPPVHNENLTIRGYNSDVKLKLPSKVSLNGNLKIDNVLLSGSSTIYANGHKFEVGNNVTSDTRLTVYGGKNGAAVDGDTYINLLGGQYGDIYGGGNGGAVSGSTNVVLGGNANPGDGIDSTDTATFSKCKVYGGGKNAAVDGKTSVTLKDNVAVYMIVGAGSGAAGTAVDTNIYIDGGKAMNVTGGAMSQTLPDGTVTHITMTDGTVESIFGGSEKAYLTGHTYVNLLGGEVIRRVYSGCYNGTEVEDSFGIIPTGVKYTGDCYVNGTTTLTIASPVKLATKNNLNGTENNVNVGVFSGSRTAQQNDAESNMVIFLDGSYNNYKNKLQDSGLIFNSYFKSFQDYTVNAGVGGKVIGTKNNGEIYIEPDEGNYGIVASGKYINESTTISANTVTAVTFEKDFNINNLSAQKENTGFGVVADITAENVSNELEPRMIIAVYDAQTGRFVGCDVQAVPQSNSNQTFKVNCEFETGKTYLVKSMIWNVNQKPLVSTYSISVQ